MEVISSLQGEAVVTGLAAGRNVELLAQQVRAFRPAAVAVAADADAAILRSLTAGTGVAVYAGRDGVEAVLADADVVVSAMVGFAGFTPTLAAVRAGKTVALANKESLVAGGELIKREMARSRAVVFPVDSEHAALAQCLEGKPSSEIKRLILTASGGPFRDRPWPEVESVSPEEALAHPVWEMGAKISVDSATLMNKGLEVIEAHWLFDMPFEKIDVVIHPQSVVHSMVEWEDGTYLAQLAPADMRLPLQYALTYPHRRAGGWHATGLQWDRSLRLDFEPLPEGRFPCFGLALTAGKAGGVCPAVLNAANEVAVTSFLEERIRFGAIPEVVADALRDAPGWEGRTYDEIVAADEWGRRRARETVNRIAG